MKECNFCHITYDPTQKYDYEKEGWRKLVNCMWAQLHYGVDRNGRPFIIAVGDDVSDYYYPKYCPECGRKLER